MSDALRLVQLLKSKNYMISFAESATGGLLASSIVDIPLASSVLAESLVTYSNEAKIKYLGVNSKTIEEYNVVSEEITYEMAKGLNKLTNSNICVSVSGVAGPTGGTKEIPVGTICFGFYINGDIKTTTMHFTGERNEVRAKARDYVFSELLKILGD